MLVIAIDAGINGAIASLDERGEIVLVGDLPVTVHGKNKWIGGTKFLPMLFAARRRNQPARVFVEYMHALPMMVGGGDGEEGGTTRGGGLYAASKKGMVLGSILAILEVAEIPFELVVPQKWKRALNLIMPQATYRERKDASLDRARMLFPKAPLHLQKHDGRAEALLIAHWAQRHVLGVPGVQTSASASASVGELDLVGGGKAA
jgi:hypothetical protein